MGSIEATLQVSSALTIGANLTVPANVHLFILGAGSLSIDTTFTLTLDGPIFSFKTQTASLLGAGTIILNGPAQFFGP